MDKFESRAKALHSGIESALRTIKECMARDESDFILKPSTENNVIYKDYLLEIQLLFYCYDPQIPLYAEVLALNKRVAEFEDDSENYARYDDFCRLKYLLGKFLNVLEFRQQP